MVSLLPAGQAAENSTFVVTSSKVIAKLGASGVRTIFVGPIVFAVPAMVALLFRPRPANQTALFRPLPQQVGAAM